MEKNIYFTLRFACAMCFIGHGSFGIIGKEIWCNYFAVFGIGKPMAHTLMPILGCADILWGVSILVYPTRTIVWWLVIWGIVTAALRPLSGEPFGELIERAGNYGAPLVLLMICAKDGKLTGNWFKKMEPVNQLSAETLAKIALCLRIVIFLLLCGHGWLNLIEKKGLMGQYKSLGFSDPENVARIAGIFEIVAALAILIKPLRGVLIALLVWKVATELFYPKWEVFEWVERGGSYGVILALLFTLKPVSLFTTDKKLQPTT